MRTAGGELLERVRRDVQRDVMRARNRIRPAGDVCRQGAGRTPKDLLWSEGHARLWRFRSRRVALRDPVVMVASLVGRSHVLDLRPGDSLVERLQTAGLDVFLLDWAQADARHAGERLEHYVDRYLPEAVGRARAAAGADDVHVLGYCFGGVLALMHAARHPDAPLRSLTAMATPVDFSRWEVWAEMSDGGDPALEAILDEHGNVPACAVRRFFRQLRPGGEVSRYATLLDSVWNDPHAAAYQAMAEWADDHVPFPGVLARQVLHMLIRDNALMHDRARIGGDVVRLRDVRVPLLAVVAARDRVVPEPVAAPLPGLVGSADADILRLDAGHVGLMAGRTAAAVTAPALVDFLVARSAPVRA